MDKVDIELVRALEQRCFNGWPTLRTVLADGWVLRLADGHTRRANSASALYPSAMSAVELSEFVKAQFKAANLPPVIRLTPLAPHRLAQELAALGWSEDDPSLGLYAPKIIGAADLGLSTEPRASDEWIAAAMHSYGYGDAGAKALRRMLDNLAVPAAFATIYDAGKPVGWGLAVAERGMVGLYDLVIAPEKRGAGLGRKLVAGLLHWGKVQGATSAYLQVRVGNAPARRLYESLGFTIAYLYTHWI